MVHHKHRHVARAAEPEAAPVVQTLVSVVYVTASPTFTGAIGGYTTIGVDPTTTEAAETTPTTTKTTTSVPSSILADTSSATAKTTASAVSSSSSVPTAILAPSTSASTTLSSAILVASSSSTLLAASSKSSTSTTSSTAAADSSAGSGMSTGGKIGLTLGILCLIGVVLSLVLFLFKRRKDAAKQHERIDDEKNDIFAANSGGRSPSTRTASTAPRLSLRPLTQFTPNLVGDKHSTGNMADSPQTNLNQSRRLSPGSAYNRLQAGQEANKNNPFGIHAETIDSANANGPTIVEDMSANGEIVPAGVAPGTAATSAGAIAVPTAAGLVRGASKRGNGPKPMDFTKPNALGPPSPAGTEFSFTEVSTPTTPGPQTPPQQSQSGAAIAAAGGPPNSTVHRVQLDFKPSMDDELELSVGQLIRVLHEYDDGWALCIRLDRSQQGVVPRTCLSTRPVKPRPLQNGPRGSQGPGIRGHQQQQRPMSPAMNQGPPRPMVQNGNPNRPMTPNGGPQQQPMTPTDQGRARSPSVAQMQAPRNSPGPSPMKPQPEIPQTASASRPSTPTVEEAPQSPPAPAMAGSVPRKPVGQAL